MQLIDDQYVDTAPEKEDVTAANLVTLRAYITTTVRAAGGKAKLHDIMWGVRKDKIGKPGWWQCVTDQMWIDAAKELQIGWNAKRAVVAVVEPKVEKPVG